MMKILIYFILFLFTSNVAEAFEGDKQKITFQQANSIISAVAAPGKKKMRYGIFQPESLEAFNKDINSSRFIMFSIAFEVGEGMSNYYIDTYTGDTFSTLLECTEIKNKKLKSLQKQIRQSLHLTETEYKKIKTKGPECYE